MAIGQLGRGRRTSGIGNRKSSKRKDGGGGWSAKLGRSGAKAASGGDAKQGWKNLSNILSEEEEIEETHTSVRNGDELPSLIWLKKQKILSKTLLSCLHFYNTSCCFMALLLLLPGCYALRPALAATSCKLHITCCTCLPSHACKAITKKQLYHCITLSSSTSISMASRLKRRKLKAEIRSAISEEREAWKYSSELLLLHSLLYDCERRRKYPGKSENNLKKLEKPLENLQRGREWRRERNEENAWRNYQNVKCMKKSYPIEEEATWEAERREEEEERERREREERRRREREERKRETREREKRREKEVDASGGVLLCWESCGLWRNAAGCVLEERREVSAWEACTAWNSGGGRHAAGRRVASAKQPLAAWRWRLGALAKRIENVWRWKRAISRSEMKWNEREAKRLKSIMKLSIIEK